jgi:hypothetical protein
MESISASPEAVLDIIIRTYDVISATFALIAQTAEAVGRLPDAATAAFFYDGLMENRDVLAAVGEMTVDKLMAAYRAGRAEERAVLSEWAVASPVLRVVSG